MHKPCTQRRCVGVPGVASRGCERGNGTPDKSTCGQASGSRESRCVREVPSRGRSRWPGVRARASGRVDPDVVLFPWGDWHLRAVRRLCPHAQTAPASGTDRVSHRVRPELGSARGTTTGGVTRMACRPPRTSLQPGMAAKSGSGPRRRAVHSDQLAGPPADDPGLRLRARPSPLAQPIGCRTQ